MEFTTRSNRTYYYDPISNRLSTKQDMDDFDMPTTFELSDEYDFTEMGMFTIEVTQQCNLRCKYCCYSGEYSKRRQHNVAEISMEDLKSCIEFITRHCGDIPKIFVCFYGGEALLCKDKIEWFIQNLKDKLPYNEMEFSISTNGLLLSESVMDWICEEDDIYLTITIDGSKAMHDKNRVTSSGQGSFESIYGNLKLFSEKYPTLYKDRVRFISTVKSIEDLIPLNKFWMEDRLLKSNRPQHISSIIPNFEKGESVSTDKEKFERVYELGMSCIREGKENILTDEIYNLIKPIKWRSYKRYESVNKITTCINSPSMCFISATGDLFACERFCTDFKIGTLKNGIDRSLCENINKQYLQRKNTYCSKCWARRLCRRCPMGLNYTDIQFSWYCDNEKMQIRLALRYFCEILEYRRGII